MFEPKSEPQTIIEKQKNDVEAQEESIDIKVDNTSSVGLKVDTGVIADFLKYWGFTTAEINSFHIVFINGKKDYPQPGDSVMGFYDKRGDERHIEVFTTLQREDEDGTIKDFQLPEDEIRNTLLHELWHAVQDRMEKMKPDEHPIEEDADDWATANVEKYQSMLKCSEGKNEMFSQFSDEKDEVISSSGKESTLVPDSEHPALHWEEEMKEVANAYESGSITIEEAIRQYIELYDRGQNMARAKENKINQGAIRERAMAVEKKILDAAEVKGKKAA